MMERNDLYALLVEYLAEKNIVPDRRSAYTFLSISGDRLYLITTYSKRFCFLIIYYNNTWRVLEWDYSGIGQNTIASTNEAFIRIDTLTIMESAFQSFYNLYSPRQGDLTWYGLDDIGFYMFSNDTTPLLPLFFNLKTKLPIKAERIP